VNLDSDFFMLVFFPILRWNNTFPKLLLYLYFTGNNWCVQSLHTPSLFTSGPFL